MVIVVAITFIIASAIAPYSEELISAQQNADSSVILFILINTAWLCLAIWYVVIKSPWGKSRLAVSLIGVLFLVTSFMTQIETFFFRSAFPILTNADIFWIFITNGAPIFTGVPLAIVLFRKRDDELQTDRTISLPPLRELIAKLAIIGLAYVFVYFLFGHFVAWQVEEVRVFYSGIAENPGFFSQLMYNLEESPNIFPFQFFRGVLFGVFILPLVSMFIANPKALLISITLVYLSTGVPLIIPNVLFPDSVRWAHFWEMISSMFIFSIIVWYVFARGNILPRSKPKKEGATT